ncbi:hypothetical protein Zmor_013290 [Zophobas morio]|uniref:Uncharacterized protein n=1 Tax=Zophobas morio TaxID=2755281 RepID=A0AA38ICW4_9CUCU|nr:hypothetical protein Zmor_013290 [Zophobas morio]
MTSPIKFMKGYNVLCVTPEQKIAFVIITAQSLKINKSRSVCGHSTIPHPHLYYRHTASPLRHSHPPGVQPRIFADNLIRHTITGRHLQRTPPRKGQQVPRSPRKTTPSRRRHGNRLDPCNPFAGPPHHSLSQSEQ